MTPVAGTGTAHTFEAQAAPPVPRTHQAADGTSSGLLGLPQVLRDEVIHHLTPRGIAALAMLNKQAWSDHAYTARDARATQLGREAQAADLETTRRLLNDPTGIAALPAFFQTAPRAAVAHRLGELARQLGDLPPEARTARFEAILQLAGQLPGPDRARAGIIGILCRKLGQLPQAEQLAAFHSLLDRVRALGTQGAQEAKYLAIEVASLPPDARHEAFFDLVDCLKRLPEDGTSRLPPSLTLARCVHALPPESHDEAAHQVAEVLRPLPAAQDGNLLSKPDLVLPAAVKDALRQALGRDAGPSPSRTGTSAA